MSIIDPNEPDDFGPDFPIPTDEDEEEEEATP